jgi:chemotaxis protein MotB
MIATLLLLTLGCAHLRGGDDEGLARQLNSEVLALRERLRTCQARAATCADEGAPSPIYGELRQILSGTDVRVSRKGSITELTLPMSLLFALPLRVRDEAAMPLDMIATALNVHPEYAIIVEGHLDDASVPQPFRKTYPTNWEYAAAHASAVARKLISEFHVDPARITVASRAHMDAVAENDTNEGRAQNRRIILRIYQARSSDSVPVEAPVEP